MYDVKSRDANEFIDDGEVRASLEEAARLAAVPGEVERILDRARACRGLSHREAAVLLRVDDETTLEKMYALAKEVKERIYGKRIVLFAPCTFPIIASTIARIAAFAAPTGSSAPG